MDMFIIAVSVYFFLFGCSAYDNFEGLLKQQDPCFPEIKVDGCNTTLADAFILETEKTTFNKPTTQVHLFTVKNPRTSEPLHACGGKLGPTTNYNPEHYTEIFVHGYLDGVCRTAWMREMRDQLLIRGSYNVILIDWSWGNIIDYAAASRNVKVVAEQLSFVLSNIVKQMNVHPKMFHIIGHSLGSHIAGFCGKMIKRILRKKIRRITALDPAFPPYGESPPTDRLSYQDARLVDVIHSNAGNCAVSAIGTFQALGLADFYPNGGSVQRSSVPYMLISFLKFDILYAIGSIIFGNHLQALQYYKVSINSHPCQFIGVECESYEDFLSGRCSRYCANKSNCAVMGMDWEFYRNTRDKKRRKYYLNTGLDCPYIDNSLVNVTLRCSNKECKSGKSTIIDPVLKDDPIDI